MQERERERKNKKEILQFFGYKKEMMMKHLAPITKTFTSICTELMGHCP